MLKSIHRILNSNFRLINDLTTVLQYQTNSKFLHNLKYTDRQNYYSQKTFEGYLNCGAVCYISSYLLSQNGIENSMVKTLVRRDYRDFDHVFILTNDCILDPTYRQLFRNEYSTNNDRFMKDLYNNKSCFFVGHINIMEDMVKKYTYDFEKNTIANRLILWVTNQNYIDIGYKQDSDKVVKDKDYAEFRGKSFLTLHNILNYRY